MQDNNNSIQQDPAVSPAVGGFPMPPNNQPAAPVQDTPQPAAPKPRRTIDGFSVSYDNNEPLSAPKPVSVPEQPVETPSSYSGVNNVFQTPVQPTPPANQALPFSPITTPVVPMMPIPLAQSPDSIGTTEVPSDPAHEPELPTETTQPTDNPNTVQEPFMQADDNNPDFINQLASEDNNSNLDFGAVPSLKDDFNPDDIVISSPKPKRFNWLTTVLIAVAILGVGASIFLFIQYRSVNGQLQNAQYQMDQYQMDAENGQKASSQLESLQNTVREQSEKITDLKKENDELKNVSDDLKKANEENAKLKTDLETRSNQISKCLSNDDCKKYL